MTDLREELMRAASQAFDAQIETGGSFEGAWNASFDALLPLIERRIAADAIEALRAERDALRDVLKVTEGYERQANKRADAAEDRAEAAEAREKRLRAALEKIIAIENEIHGGDWDEIEEARSIASAALAGGNDDK